MDRWMARQEDGCRQVLAHNEYEIKKANTMHGWMCPHGDRCRYVLDNNEHKIKNDIHRWMGRHGNGCRYVNDNEYKIKKNNENTMDGPSKRRLPKGWAENTPIPI